MNYRDLSDGDLAEFAKNVAHRLTSHEVECLDAVDADKFGQLIGPENEAFEADIAESMDLAARKMAVNSRKAERRAKIIEALSRTQRSMRVMEGSETDFARCGFTKRKPWARYTADDPTELTVARQSNGTIKLRFRGNNKRGMVVFEIWRREKNTSPWTSIAAPSAQRYTDKNVMPGTSYQYKVQAVARNSKSNFSNMAVVV